ncbi:MAG: glucuronate isomerase [Planctomycetes bacterium]|jgi:hypothetical protein|nr:glucuronate isomerase [Phycisphaerae bacterium]NBB95241.1 glucuronate isomerase [Planctomycetota bacterium]
MSKLTDPSALARAVEKAVAECTITDIHTHLFPPAHDELLLWGVDELLTYHYLVAELFATNVGRLAYENFWHMSKSDQAALIWKTLFVEHGPISESQRGVLTTLRRLGLDVGNRDLGRIRKWFAEQNIDSYLPKVFELAGLDYAVMTNDPFVPIEAQQWDDCKPGVDLLRTALRIDPLIVNWPKACEVMSECGFEAENLDEAGYAEARRFLDSWVARLNPLYMAASLPPDFHFPAAATMASVVENVVIPTARQHNLPMAMMIGVRKRINPALGDAGDGVGTGDVTAVQNLCMKYPDVKFLVTMLSRVNQHELTVLARKCPNLHLFGCWWFCNNPSIIDEMTRQRIEMLGTAVTLQHSDARVLDQLIYKWAHTRKIVANVLTDKYTDILATGWQPTEAEIARDARDLLGGSFEDFIAAE